MSELGEFVNKYAVSARLEGKGVVWQFRIETERGRHELDIADGAEVPILLDLVRKDRSVFYNPESRTLSTGWNDPGT